MKPFLLKVFFLCLLIVPAAAQTSLNFDIVDGKTNKPVTEGITVQKNVTAAQNNAPEICRFTIKNTSADERWIYLNWSVAFASNTGIDGIHYWDGQGEALSGNALLEHPSADAAHDTTMLQAVYDGNQGVALALPPDEIVSQLTQSLDTSPDKKYILHLQIPLVLDAGQSDTFPIEIYHFTPRYGFLDALQQYFSAHPAAFNARNDIDPRAAGVGDASIVRPALETSEELAFETGRRFYSDWDWVYAPFKRTGDIYGREQFWNYQTARPSNAWRNKGATAADYHAKRSSELKNLDDAGIAGAFYTPSFSYSEIQLAKDEYPNAIIYNPDGSYYMYYTTPWVTGPDNEVMMYPWGNKFARQSMDDARQLVAENDIPAFGYDVFSGGVPYRGEGMKESPRRAFDDKGEYVDSSVAVAKMADFTRSLTKNGRATGLVGNATGQTRPFLVTRADSLMFEQPPYYHASDFVALRYAAGHKMITIWNPWRLVNLLKWQQMTTEQLQDAYHGAADYLRLSCFRYGSFPSPRWASGVPQIMRMLPLIKEVISEGWQAVPAVRATHGELPGYIWPARYGNDVGSYITIGNAVKEPWHGQIAIDNDYLGTANYLFADVDGTPLPQTVKGRVTLLQVQIPAHETLVLRAVAALPANAAGDATVAWKDDGANGALNIQSSLSPAKVVSPRNGWRLANHDKQNWNFNSLYFASPLKNILDFPYFGDATTAQIVLPKNASDQDQQDAKHLQEYFIFWGKSGMQPARDIQLPILTDPAKINTALPVIYLGAPATQRRGQALYVGDAKQLMNMLDQKYFYYGTLSPGPTGGEVLKKALLNGPLFSP